MKPLRVRPSGLWLIVGPIYLCMWMAAVNYTNNLVYAILYLLGALSFISVFHGWRYLAPLQVRHVEVVSAHAGGVVLVKVHLHNPGRSAISGLFFREQTGNGEETVLPLLQGQLGHVAAESSARLLAALPALKRGRYRLNKLVLNSLYPLGLFRISRLVEVGTDYYVYPRQQGTESWPEYQTGPATGQAQHPTPGDNYGGLRSYVSGDSIRQIDWRSYARGRSLAVKFFTGGEASELWLDAGALRGLAREAQLSQLAQWIHEAEAAAIPYGLRGLGRDLPPGLGPVHAQRMLEFLAGVPEEESPA